jgi:hypothetical protein
LLIEKNRPLTRFEKVLLTLDSIRTVGMAVTLVFGVLFLLQATIRYRTKTFLYLDQVLGRTAAQLTLAFLVLLVAALASVMKQRQQGLYGLTEIVFGAGSAVNIALAMAPGSSTSAHWLGLLGCAYIIASGLSNVTEWQDRIYPSARERAP